MNLYPFPHASLLVGSSYLSQALFAKRTVGPVVQAALHTFFAKSMATRRRHWLKEHTANKPEEEKSELSMIMKRREMTYH